MPSFSLPPRWAPQGNLLWWTAVKAAVQQAGHFLSNCCCWFPLCPQKPEPKLLAQVAHPLFCCIQLHELSPVFKLQAHAIHDKHSHPWDTWVAQDPAVLYERQYRNNWSTLQQCGGGRRSNGCENADAPMNYSGWHLAAAGPRVSKAVPGLVTVDTSGSHGELKTL